MVKTAQWSHVFPSMSRLLQRAKPTKPCSELQTLTTFLKAPAESETPLPTSELEEEEASLVPRSPQMQHELRLPHSNITGSHEDGALRQ